MKYKAIRLYKDQEISKKYGNCLDCFIDLKTMAIYCSGNYLGVIDPKEIKWKTLKLKARLLYEIPIYIKKIMG